MAVKKYIATIACRDDLTRTITIMKQSTTAETIEMVVTDCSIDMDSSEDAFTAFRKTTGSITIYNQYGRIDPQDLMPTTSKSHIVSIVNSNNVCEFYGYVGMETRSQNYPFEGETFDIPIVDMFSIANAYYMQKATSTTLANSPRTMLELIYYALGAIGFDSSLYLPKLFVPDGDTTTLNYSDAYNVKTTLFNVNKESDLDEDDPDYEYWEGITIEEFLEKVANFYGFTWVQYGYDAYAVAQDVTDYLSFDIEQQISEDDISSESFNMSSIKKETGNSIDYIAQPSKVSVKASREEGDIITGLDADDWKFNRYYNRVFGDFGFFYNTFYSPTKNGLSEFKKYKPDDNDFYLSQGGQFVEFSFNGGSSGSSSFDGNGIMILPFENGFVNSSASGTKLTDNDIVATFRSNSSIHKDLGRLKLSLKGLSIFKSTTGVYSYKSLVSTTYGKVYCRIYLGNTEINADSRQLVFTDPTDDGLYVCKSSKIIPLTNGDDFGPIKLEFYCSGGTACAILISDIEVSLELETGRNVLNVDDKGKSDINEYKWFEKTEMSGDKYDHDIYWVSYHKNNKPDCNSLSNSDGTPFTTVTGSYGNYSYEKYLCKRITDIYEHKSYRMHIVTKLGEINSVGISKLPIATIGRHIVTGFSRNYGSGTDTIHLDSF